MPFRGINILLFSDFGQLRLARAYPLFSKELVHEIRPNIGASDDGQITLHGALLWQQVDKVINLCKNMWQADDPAYADLVGYVHLGQAMSMANGSTPSDLRVLSSRSLNAFRVHILRSCPNFGIVPSLLLKKNCVTLSIIIV